ncbi:peptidase C56 family protein [Sphingomonas changbaiensis NBRC 104936]|uniref:Peptidase C56 family protein n=1 Tax=Sphingomonas changbaiensis NBRC 104936 TaxID=1219043 RepID=A0A0E9MTT2_9SPHN|nr:type 1 glutamine amidotransferase domain-containing protein [Sphingomonas changbaiensis]GAO40969.1 peptidase C56 family protein [Sphingomonas changbaiensis NBRC 104936]
MAQGDRAKVLMLATDGFEQSELFDPRRALRDAGYSVTLASNKREPIQGMKHDEKGETITPDALLGEVNASEYDMLVLPGGVANPDKLRTEPDAVKIVCDFMDRGAPVAAICHGPWLLAEADVLRGRTVTAWPSIRTDLRNAGADVVDMEVVIDRNLITSRKPADIPAFNDALLETLRARTPMPA